MIINYTEFILEKNNPCWKGYKQIGTKNKNGKSVPNCVKVGTMKGDMIKKPVKAFKGLAVEIFEKTDTAHPQE